MEAYIKMASVLLVALTAATPAEDRAVKCVKDPESCFDIEMEDLTYRSHSCRTEEGHLICTACYDHPKNYLGSLSIRCSHETAVCKDLSTNEEWVKYKIDLNYCMSH